MTITIDGKVFADNLRKKIKHAVSVLNAKHNLKPGLAAVLVGEDPASQVYVRNKGRKTVEVGMKSIEYKLPVKTSQEQILNLIDRLNNDMSIHGILVQLPLPSHIDQLKIINAISVDKDVDGFHIENSGKLTLGENSLVPCTPVGCLMLLKSQIGSLSGNHAIVIGRSNIVGKPVSMLLLKENCTVTIGHSMSKNLPELCRQADILVVAVGIPQLVTRDWIKPGAVVIDVGINRVETKGKIKLVGDVNFEEAIQVASAVTPVPGGVGPMTIACLLRNTVLAACYQNGISIPSSI